MRHRHPLARAAAALALFFPLALSWVASPPRASAQAKTRVADFARDAAGNPLPGKITFVLTQKSAAAPDGLVVASPSVSATVDSAGKFDVSVYPSASLSPVSYYQVYVTSGAGSQALLGVYSIPASSGIVTLAPYKVTNASLAAQYTFADAAAVAALSAAVSNATVAALTGITRDDTKFTFDRATVTQGSQTVNGSQTVGGTLTALNLVGNGAGISGLTGATGGVSNTGSTTVGADTDADGVGVVDPQTGGQTRLRVNNNGVVEAFQGIRVLDRGGQVFNIVAYGADPTGVADSTAAIAAARAAAEAARGVLFAPPGDYLVSAASGTEIFLVTVPIRIHCASPASTNFVVKSTTPATASVIRFRPTVAETNSRGFEVRGCGFRAQSGAPGDAAVVLDVTGGAFISNWNIEGNHFHPLGGEASVVLSNPSAVADGIFTGTFRDNYFADDGVRLVNAGDTINFLGRNVFSGAGYALKGNLVGGATTLNLDGVNITSKQGVLITGGNTINITHSIVEGYQSGTTGQGGAMIFVQGASAAARVAHVNVSHSVIGSVGGVSLDGIRVEYADHFRADHNYFNQPAGKVGVRVATGAIDSYVDQQTNKQYGKGQVVSNSADPRLVLGSVKAYEATPSASQGGRTWVDYGVFSLGVQLGAISFAAIGTNFPNPAPGQAFFCTDCTPGTTPCAGGSAVGALAVRTSNNQWSCK